MKNLKTLFIIRVIALITALTAVSVLQAQPKGRLDVDSFVDTLALKPKVNLNLPSFIIHDMLGEYDEQTLRTIEGMGINLDTLLQDIQSIRVLVFDINENNRAQLTTAGQRITAELNNKWIPIITVPEQNVGVYSVSDETGKRMAGLAVFVQQPDVWVVVNIEGRIPIGTLLQLASRSQMLPDDLFQKLEQSSQQKSSETPPAPPAPPTPPTPPAPPPR